MLVGKSRSYSDMTKHIIILFQKPSVGITMRRDLFKALRIDLLMLSIKTNSFHSANENISVKVKLE